MYYHTPQDFDFNEFKFKILKGAFTKVIAFLGKWF